MVLRYPELKLDSYFTVSRVILMLFLFGLMFLLTISELGLYKWKGKQEHTDVLPFIVNPSDE